MLDSFSAQPRDYQADGIVRGLESPYGLFWWPTGSGKTVLFSALIRCYNLPTLILTHRKELLFQLQHEISQLTGEEVGIIGAGSFDPKRWTVGLVNSLMKNKNVLREARVTKFLRSIEYLIIDECHHLGANSWWKIASLCTNTRARHGFSGTCFRTDNADLLLLAHTGDVISKYSTSQLIEWGWLSRPLIYNPHIKGKVKPAKTWSNVERECIQNNDARNVTCCEFVYDRYEKGDQILIMVKLVEHGMKVKNLLIQNFGVDTEDVRYMSGSVGNEARKMALEDFKYGVYPILIGTSIYNEGVDLPTIGAAVNMAGGDSDIATTQRLGRAIRKKREEGEIDVDPDVEQTIHYMDPFDLSHRFVRRHSRSRMKVYEGERAFELIGDYEA